MMGGVMVFLETPLGRVITFLIVSLIIAAVTRGVTRRVDWNMMLAFTVGSAITVILFWSTRALSIEGTFANPFFVTAFVLAIVAAWRFLFGPWDVGVKATVLGTFTFWYALDMLAGQDPSDRLSTVLATSVAIIPAVIWCIVFLRQHRERLSIVLLTFLAGMLSTAPILFYDFLQRRGLELHAFLFRIVPENFHRSSETFVSDTLVGVPGVHGTVIVTLVSFLLVGVIEELSKNWVVRKSDRNFFSSIDDVIQLSIVAAIGFAFAENVVNPSYFAGFIQNYLISPPQPQWGLFFGGILGRAVLTNMVHIVSSGLFGYYYGLAFFAGPLLREEADSGRRHPLLTALHRVLQVRSETIYAEEKVLEGFLFASIVHGLFDVLVTLPEILPGHPQTFGDLAGMGGVLGSINLIVIPALLYTVGGWLLLVYLFSKKEDLKEFGHIVDTQVFEQERRRK